MISAGEISAGVTGAFRLARRDPGGMVWFDASPRGFWNSFWVAALLAPAFLALDLLAGGLSSDVTARQVLVKLIGYVIDWTAFPVVMITVADSLGKWPNYRRYIVAYNWSTVVQMAIMLPIGLLVAASQSHGVLLLAQAASILLLVYRAYVAHVGLSVNLGTATGIVLLDVLLGALLRLVTDRLAGG